MSTNGFWGFKKNNTLKLIYNHYDSYPSALGKEVINLVQNEYAHLDAIFDKLIMLKNVHNLAIDHDAEIIITSPDVLIGLDKYEKYYATSALEAFKEHKLFLEYGYIIDFDESTFKCYTSCDFIGETPINNINYRDIKKIFNEE